MCFHSGSLFLDRSCSGSSLSWSEGTQGGKEERGRGKTEQKEGLSGEFKEASRERRAHSETAREEQRGSGEESGTETVMVEALRGRRRGGGGGRLALAKWVSLKSRPAVDPSLVWQPSARLQEQLLGRMMPWSDKLFMNKKCTLWCFRPLSVLRSNIFEKNIPVFRSTWERL